MRTIYIIGIVALLSAMMVMPASAETWYVHPTDPKYTVYYIMQQASPGDTIFFYNGTYDITTMGTQDIYKPNITWKGEGADVVTIDCLKDEIGMEATGCVFDGFTVVNSGIGAHVTASDCIIRNCVFDGLTGSTGIDLRANNITFENNVVLNATSTVTICAVRMFYSSNSVFRNNVVSNTPGAAVGLKGDYSTCANNIIANNDFISNNYGIWLYYADEGNRIYLNNFIDNGADVTKSTAYWNSTEPIEYIYNGATYTSHLGNYWSDYTGKDDGGDGIGDSSYTVKAPSNVDDYPLMQPFANYPEAKLPDLTTAAMTAHPLVMNQPSTITATIANIGTADASPSSVSLSVNGTVVNSTSIPALSAGTSTDVIFPWTPASTGDYELCVAADPDDVIRERDEANNDRCVTVTVGAPDLTTTAINAPPLFVNLTSTITAAIANIGTADASAFSVSLSADGSVVNTASVPSLNAGSSTNVSFSWTPASAGDYDLCVVADTDDAIDEPDETNNATCTIVTVSEVSAEIVWQHGALVPWDAERLSGGNTLIAEYGNHTVIEVTPASETVWLYGTGTAGSGENELNSPAAAERLTGGNTLIVDRNNHRVFEVNPAGSIVWQYGTTGVSGSGANELYNPMDAERLSNGNTLIADRLNNRVIEVTPAGGISWEITGLNHPFDASRLPDGNTLVVEYKNHRVIEMTPAGEVVWQYGTGTPGSGMNELNYPSDAERLSNGDTLIVDAQNDRVIMVRTSHYDPARANNGFSTRSIVWEYGSNYPMDAEQLSNGNTLIAEAGNDRVIEVLTPLTKQDSSTPFMIFGEVNHDIDEPILDLNVTVVNMDTTGDFYVEVHDNFYQVVTASGRILAGDTLHFCASDDNTTELNHTVTVEEMDNGGFVQNITIVSPIVWMPDLTVTAINAYHNNTACPAWFNLSNEVDVTIENVGTTPANESDVSLYIDGVFFGRLPVPGMAAGASEIVTFTGWIPVGEDCLQAPCEFAWSYKDYNFTAVADCDNDIDEHDEANNETTIVDRTCYNGYMADDPLENVAHGMLNGGVLFTTGDGVYTGLYNVGSSAIAHYDITLPEGASVELAHLNVYYTWHYELDTCPQLEVSITNATGRHIVPLKKAYNDHKCTCPGAAWVFPWGNYVYDVTDYIRDSGSYTVTVTRTGGPSVCVAARGINLVYEDQDAPLIEYWINEGADVLMGGRRYPTSSNLAWWENINNATFQASVNTSTVKSATLGVVSPWAGSSWEPGMTNYLFFNDVKLGTGVYHGYGETYDKTINSITMHVGSTNGQVGVNVTNVTGLYLKGSDNVVGQCDDGDNMMPCNAFLVVEYGLPTTNELPVADAGLDQNALVNESVTFNGSGSYDPDGTIVSYEWDFGDGTNAIGVTPTHAYATVGTYTVTLTVTDDEGATGMDTALVLVNATVPNEPPVADAGQDQNILVNETVMFNGSGSYDPDGTIVSYDWDFGDGTNGTGETTTHAYAIAGTYTVTLTVTDNDGATGMDTALVLVNATVPNEPPVADAGQDQNILVNETVMFNGSGSYDPDGTIVSYNWTFGDGTNGTSETTTHAYATAGTYTVTLTVTDNEGATGTDTASVNVVAEGILQAGVTFDKKKIDLNSSGILKAFITLPDSYDVANISVSTVTCEGAPIIGSKITGINVLEAKFNIQNLTVPTGPEVLLTVTGELFDGTPFEGSNTVEVV